MQYEVVSPVGSGIRTERIPLASRRTGTLDGKTVCELSVDIFREREVFPVVRNLLQQRFRDVKIVPHTEFPEQMVYGSVQEAHERLRTTVGLLKQKGCDAVISGIGG